MTDLVAAQAELLAQLRAQTDRPVWPSDTLVDLGLRWPGAAPQTSVAELIVAAAR